MATGSAAVPDTWVPQTASGKASEGLRRDRLPDALGWASAIVGAPLLLASRAAVEAIGMGDAPGHRRAAEFVGIRDLAAAAGLLLRSSPAWLWARVGGDLADMTLLGLGAQRSGLLGRTRRTGRMGRIAGPGRMPKNVDRSRATRVAVAAAGMVGLTGVDLYAAMTRSRPTTSLRLTSSVTVAVPALQAYELWRLLERLPAFLTHVDEVRVTGPDTSHWRASAPFGAPVEWDAQIVDDVPGERLAWLSLAGGAVANAGDVAFSPAPGGRGTEIHLTLYYRTSGARAATALARYFGERPARQLDGELRRFKQIAETGEVVRSEGAPGGKYARRQFPQHPARPLSRDELIEVLS
jgi:uncharacterized membrane protein